MVPTVHRHHTHSRKHDGQAQINYLNAFINLFWTLRWNKENILKVHNKYWQNYSSLYMSPKDYYTNFMPFGYICPSLQKW